MTPLRPRLNFEQLCFSDTLRPSLNFGDPVSPSQFGSLHHCSFISLVTTLVFSFLYNRCILTASDTALADTMAFSGRINNDDSNERDDNERRRRAKVTADV
jgi:hypothetical protein